MQNVMKEGGEMKPSVSNPDIDNKRIIWVKKNLIDPTAALVYGLGASIIHLAMTFAIFFVKQVDLDVTHDMHQACKDEAE